MTVDTVYVPRASLLRYVEGSPWEVTYYSQVLAKDSEPGPQDLGRSPTDQQYIRITNMEILVSSALRGTQDAEGRHFEVTGSSTVYPHLKPNLGDMFVADIGDGRAGLFTVTRAEQKTHMRDSYCEIDYKLIAYADAESERIADLTTKTVRSTVFVKEFLSFGQNPQVLESDFEDLLKLRQHLKDLTNFFFLDFYSHNYQTLMVPGQKGSTYDPYLVQYMSNIITADEAPAISRMRQPYVGAWRGTQVVSLWTCLEQLNENYLHASVRQARLLDTKAFRGLPEISGIYFTGIDFVVCPADHRTDIDSDYDHNVGFSGAGTALQVTGKRWKDLTRYVGGDLDGFAPINSTEMPDIVPVTIDEHYVLSQAFYQPFGTQLKSKLEVLVKQALRQEPIDKVTLLKVCNNAMKWPNLERYYYIPVLLTLLKVATRTN